MLNNSEKNIHLWGTQTKLKKYAYGEWIEEPDRVFWKYKNHLCIINRIDWSGALCGYVKIRKDHPWYGRDYNSIKCDCHGGLTFSDYHKNDYFLGFDCAHFGDLLPGILPSAPNTLNKYMDGGISLYYNYKWPYKNINFVKSECESIVDQAILAKEKTIKV